MVKQLPLAPNQSKHDCSSVTVISDCVSCKKTLSSDNLCSPTLKAQPPTPRATEPSLCSSLSHMQRTYLLSPLRLWFSAFSILPRQFALSSAAPHPPSFSSSEGRRPPSLQHSPRCMQGSPSPALPSLVSHLQGHHFFSNCILQVNHVLSC